MALNALLEDVPYQDLKRAYHQLEKKNKDLVDGLYYAAFVQQGLMPQARHFEKLNLPYFIYYSPLHIIGGDFFWIGKKGDWCIYAVGDCTGHGVSGAMLSSLAIGFLNYVVYSKYFNEIGDILSEIDKKWIETFNRNDDAWIDNDWMELSMIAYNPVTQEMQFAGAGGSILYLNNENELMRLKGNNYPVGGWQIELNRKYKTERLQVTNPAKVFLYSDGFKDQFGGLNEKRLGQQKFNKLIHSSAYMNCQNQKDHLEYQLNVWRGTVAQTDDVCLLRVDL